MRRARLEFWLWLSTLAQDRALDLAVKENDVATVVRIHDSIAVWLREPRAS